MKRLFFVFFALIIACSLFGCKKSQSGEGGSVTLTVWNWDSSLMDLTVPVFQRSHPNINFELVPVDQLEMPLKIQQSIAAGLDMTDIIWSEKNTRGQMLNMDIWENLSAAPYNVDKSVFFEATVNLMSNSRGEIVAVEQSLNPAGMAYRKDLARQYLGTDDRAALEGMFSTLDDFVTKGAEVARISGGTVFMFSSPQWVLEWLREVSPKLIDSDGTINFTDMMRNGVEFLIKLRDAGAVDVLGSWTPQSMAAFAGDNHIFHVMANWGINYLIKPNDPEGQGRWGFMIPPTGGFSWGGSAQGIYKGSRHKAEAWEFLNWFSFTQEGVETIKRGANFTPVKSFYNDPGFISDMDPFFGFDVGQFFYRDIMANMAPATFTNYDTYLYETGSGVAGYIVNDRAVTTQEALAFGVEELSTRVNVRVR